MSTNDQSTINRLLAARMPKAKKEPTPIPKQSEKKKAQVKAEKEAGTHKPLEDWFDHHMANAEPVCMNCGNRADWVKQPGYEHIWKACQAHILPKKKGAFPSLAGNLDNHLVLFPSFGGTLCGCHGWFDSSWYNASTMEVWPKAVDIFKTKLLPLIHPDDRRKLPEQLQKLIDQ